MSTTGQPLPRTPDTALFMEAARDLARVPLCLPFDALRTAYATAVRLDIAKRSMLASRDVEVAVHRLEQLALGPVARQV